MSLRRSIPFSVSHQYYYDLPEMLLDRERLLDAVVRKPPPGWSRRSIGLYCSLRPSNLELPEQGWKIHVSSTLDSADHTINAIWSYCEERGLAFKFLRSTDAILQNNSKYWPRQASGKFVTIYPEQSLFEQTVKELDVLLAGTSGPYILSDIRFRDGPVFVRFGAFANLTCSNRQGERLPAIRAPSGELVPDQRGTLFTLPAFIELPEFLGDYVDPSSSLHEIPFVIEDALHISNAGGIYKARRRDSVKSLVLREARPHAGLDNNRRDSVARLLNEKATLQQLSGLNCVPRLLDHCKIWEHDFLATEFIEGKTLLMAIIHRYPFAHPKPDREELVEYLRWTEHIHAQLGAALGQIHDRGIEVVDVHPSNIIVRPDGGVTLIDFECARQRTEQPMRPLGALGFTGDSSTKGSVDSEDAVALSRVLLMMLIPIVPVLSLDAGKTGELVAAARSLFAADDGLGRQFDALVPRIKVRPEGRKALPTIDYESWPHLRTALVDGLFARMIADRDDVLFRCDALQFTHGTATFGYGAAGIAYALAKVGTDVPQVISEWLYARARDGSGCKGLGFFDGRHGVAYALYNLGLDDMALSLLDLAASEPLPKVDSLFSGKAGVILNLLHLGRRYERKEALAQAAKIGTEIAGAILAEPKLLEAYPCGLMHGPSGIALMLINLYEELGDEILLDAADLALKVDIAAGRTLDDGVFHIFKQPKYLIYLDEGSIGLALVLDRFQKHRPDAEIAAILRGVTLGCNIPFTMHPGLLQGRAGLIAGLATLRSGDDVDSVREQAARLTSHLLYHEGHLAFPGNGLTKIVDDFASGTAGILLTLDAVFSSRPPAIPFLCD